MAGAEKHIEASSVESSKDGHEARCLEETGILRNSSQRRPSRSAPMRLSAGVVNALMDSMQSAGLRELADNEGRMQTSLHSSMPPLGGDNEGIMKEREWW